MPEWGFYLLAAIGSVIASSGFWTYVIRRMDRKDVTREMLIGLGHDRIMYLAMKYIEQGWISHEEYENLFTFLYTPYSKMNGNGSAKRAMDEVNKLQLCRGPIEVARMRHQVQYEKDRQQSETVEG